MAKNTIVTRMGVTMTNINHNHHTLYQSGDLCDKSQCFPLLIKITIFLIHLKISLVCTLRFPGTYTWQHIATTNIKEWEEQCEPLFLVIHNSLKEYAEYYHICYHDTYCLYCMWPVWPVYCITRDLETQL